LPLLVLLPPFPMNHRLNIRFEQLETATEKLLTMAESLGSRSHEVPSTDQWSAAQVVYHLIASEKGIQQYLQHKLQEEEKLERGSLKGMLQSMFLRVVLRFPGIKFKAPKQIAALVPPASDKVAPLTLLRQQWAALRRQLEQLLNEYPGHLTNRAIFKHPRAGMLTIQQTLDFMVDHVLHHQQQMQRIMKALGPVA
jgi:uncharacterized damage-inducible protein DinB